MSATLILFANQILLTYARYQIARIFPGSHVSIKNCSFNPLRFMTLRGVEIQKKKVFKLKIDEMDIRFKWPDLYRKEIENVVFKNARLDFKNERQNIQDYLKLLFSEKSSDSFKIQKVKLSNIRIKIKTNDIDLELRLFVEYDILQAKVYALKAKLIDLKIGSFCLENAIMKIQPNTALGEMTIDKAQIDKAEATQIMGQVFVSDHQMDIHIGSAKLFGGIIEGTISVLYKNKFQYLLKANVTGISAEKIIHDYALSDKVNMKGTFEGEINIEGRLFNLDQLKGSLRVLDPGGILTITDEDFLANIAEKINQSLEFVRKSFKEYEYTNGNAQIYLEKKDLTTSFHLQGAGGKRNIAVIIHNYKREE